MHPLDRTQDARHDLDWVPASIRARRWTVSAAIWTGVAGGCLAVSVLNPAAIVVLPKLLVLAGAGGLWVGDRAGRTVLRERVLSLARGEVELPSLDLRSEGELVAVRGRVRAEGTLPGVLHGAPAVFRRLTFMMRGTRMIHEAGVDFGLVDSTGERISVQVRDARLVTPPIELADYPARCFNGFEAPGSLRETIARARIGEHETVEASEQLVRDGDELRLVGYKTRSVDPSVQSRLERETPMRAALRSGRVLPLLLYKDPPAALRDD